MLRQLLTFRCVSCLLAALLAVTAALKLHLLLTDPFADIKAGTSLLFLWLAVIVECGIACLVFSKAPDFLQWLGLISLFGLFTGVSAFKVAAGNESCGCAGLIDINPIWILGFDVLAVLLLAKIGFNTGLPLDGSRGLLPYRNHFLLNMSSLAAGSLGAIVFTIAVTGLNHATNRFVEPSIGQVQWSDDFVEFNFILTNHSDTSLQILGVKSSCHCLIPLSSSMTRAELPPNESCRQAAKFSTTRVGSEIGVIWYIFEGIRYTNADFSFLIPKERLDEAIYETFRR